MIDEKPNLTVLTGALVQLQKNGYYDSNDTIFFYDPKPKEWYTPEEKGLPVDDAKSSRYEFLRLQSTDEFTRQIAGVASGIRKTPMNIIGAVTVEAFVISNYDYDVAMELICDVMSYVNEQVHGFYEKLESAKDKVSFFAQVVGKLTL